MREIDAIKADRNRLLGRVSQLEKDTSKLETLERLKASAVSTSFSTLPCAALLVPLIALAVQSAVCYMLLPVAANVSRWFLPASMPV